MSAVRTAAVLVLAKEPRPGRVKTRLQSRFSPTWAARLAEAALRDTLAVVAAVDVPHRVLVLDGEPGPWLPPGFAVLAQRGDGLDERLAAAFTDAAQLVGPGPLVLVGMDTPQLTPDLLELDWSGTDAVVGPAADGGFWLLGLAGPSPDLLRGIPMSTERTGAELLDRLHRNGSRTRLLPVLRDVDTPGDAAAVTAEAPASVFAQRYREALQAGPP